MSARSERYQVFEDKTPEIAGEPARRLLKSIAAPHDVGRHDFAVIGILIYTAARVRAIAKLRRRDFYEAGDQFCLRFHEKGCKVREIPVRHDLQLSLNKYLDQSGLRYADPSSPLFRTAIRRTKRLNTNPMSADDNPSSSQTAYIEGIPLPLLPRTMSSTPAQRSRIRFTRNHRSSSAPNAVCADPAATPPVPYGPSQHV